MGLTLKPEYLRRYKDIALLFWKYGHSDLVNHSGLEGVLEKPTSDDDLGPEELAHDLERMGPIYIKLGQVLSSRPDLLPETYIKALARLQDKLDPFSYAEVETAVQEELGVRISKAFESFDPEPIASASLGQVHRATLRDGRPVAVKVQRPNIREAVAGDLGALQDIAEFMDEHTDAGRQYQLVDILGEFRRTLVRELDYRQEARNLVELGKNLASFPHIVVPQPIDSYTTSRILTMDFVQGRKITSLGPLAPMEMNGAELSEELFRAYLKQILVDGFFHADPHPGNVFVTNEYDIALIDLGMTGRLTPMFQEHLLKLLLAIGEMRSDEAANLALSMGERTGSSTREFSESEFRRKLAQMLDERIGGTLQEIQMGSVVIDYARVCSESGIRMPVELTILGKTLLNLDDIGRILDPQFDPNASIKRNAMSITRERMAKSLTPSAVLSAAMEAKEFAQEFPGRINKILDVLAKNQFTIQVDAIEEETLVEGFQKVANRIATGVILAALIIGAAMLMRIDTAFRLFGYPGLAILCFLIAAIGGMWLVTEVAINDRRARKKSGK